MVKTRWYPGSIKPVRKGWYERQGSRAFDVNIISYWNGHKWIQGWFVGCPVPSVHKGPTSTRQDLKWRGAAQ